MDRLRRVGAGDVELFLGGKEEKFSSWLESRRRRRDN